MDLYSVVYGKGRVAAFKNSCLCVAFQFGNERGERVAQVRQVDENLVSGEKCLHHDEAHEVQAEIACDGGRVDWGANPALMNFAACWGGLVDASATAGRLLRDGGLGLNEAFGLQSFQGWVECTGAGLIHADGRVGKGAFEVVTR